ncbi:hypothetical protein ACFRCW_46690 [Streptomyces sp. NPDC056653]|uniref:hypothetical protein n=1 Tax=Streptomyces sp. NPDC056653 TaxID=3345894 RepID=UPI003685A8CE
MTLSVPPQTSPAGRTATLNAGRAAAAQRRRADSEQCRQRVLDVLTAMRKNHQSLSDAEITRRARVNPQYQGLVMVLDQGW